MNIYYIHKGETLELIVEKGENQTWRFQVLLEFLQDLEKLSKNVFLGCVPLKITNVILPHKIIIESPNLFVRDSLDAVVSLLKVDDFNLVFHEGNKTKIYYVETSIHTLELTIEDAENQERQFKLFCECLRKSVEEIRKNTKSSKNFPLEIINIVPYQFKIVIKSFALCFGSSIASLLINKGFNMFPHPTNLSKELFFNTIHPRCEVSFLKDTNNITNLVPIEHDQLNDSDQHLLKTSIWQKIKLKLNC